jgi:hypothetical protein
MKEKHKKTIKIVDKSSISYTFTDNNPIYTVPTEEPEDATAQKKAAKTSLKDIQKQDRHKASSKKIKSLQGHSPVYE